MICVDERTRTCKHSARAKRGMVDGKKPLGDLLRDGLRGRSGKLTMKTVEIPDPPQSDARAVHKLRDQLGLSQGLFAKLVGVSQKLVETWEAGTGRRRGWLAG